MPRYFFHLADGTSFKDDQGMELADRAEAWRVTLRFMGSALIVNDGDMQPGEGMVLTVVEDGTQVCWRITIGSQSFVPDP